MTEKDVKERIQRYLYENKISQRAVAMRTGMYVGHINDWLNDRHDSIYLKTFLRMLDGMGLELQLVKKKKPWENQMMELVGIAELERTQNTCEKCKHYEKKTERTGICRHLGFANTYDFYCTDWRNKE